MTKLFDFKQVFTNIPELLLKLPVTLELAFLAQSGKCHILTAPV